MSVGGSGLMIAPATEGLKCVVRRRRQYLQTRGTRERRQRHAGQQVEPGEEAKELKEGTGNAVQKETDRARRQQA